MQDISVEEENYKDCGGYDPSHPCEDCSIGQLQYCKNREQKWQPEYRKGQKVIFKQTGKPVKILEVKSYITWQGKTIYWYLVSRKDLCPTFYSANEFLSLHKEKITNSEGKTE